MVTVIVNPQAGGGRTRRVLPAVQAELERLGVRYSARFSRSLDDARELARTAAAAGEIVAAFGGDGLVAAVAGALRGTGGVLGVIPGGRGNDFARSLGVPIDPVKACAVIAAGRPAAVDLGVATSLCDDPEADREEHLFVGIAISGLDAETNRLANESRLHLGRLVYLYSALRALSRWRPLHYRLVLDGRPLSLSGYMVSAANGSSYGGGMHLAPTASLADGRLDVVLVSEVSKLRLLKNLPKVFGGNHLNCGFMTIVRGQELEIHADRECLMYADGDPLLPLPVKLSVDEHALQVLVGP
jgi:YegS/Rv2252/BmrU family lipid kinase